MTILHCELGNHNWERESQRGRPPRNCPEHQPVKPDIKVSVKKDKPTSQSVFDIVPGLAEIVQQEKMRTYHCEYGEGHEWQQESRRGRSPRFCPEHRERAIKAVNSQPKVISPEQIEKAKKKLEDAVQYHLTRVATAEQIDNTAYEQLISSPDRNEDVFNHWLRNNSNLLNEIVSLRAQESKLAHL